MKFEDLKAEYAQLWASMVTRSSFKPAIEASANKILANKARYQAVSDMTHVPWFVIGLIHQMEAGCNFGCHLHNGDSLARKTKNVPANRPATGVAPYKWEASACDALLMKGLEAIELWSVERIAFELERYNGWGHRLYHKTTLTPYLWSGTTHYARGKYVADGKWDSTAVSGQTGAMALMHKLIELDESVRPVSELEIVSEPFAPEETTPGSFVKADGKASEKGMSVKEAAVKVAAPVAAVATAVQQAPVIPPVPESVTQTLTNVELWKTTGAAVWTLKAWAMAEPFLASGLAISMGGFYVWSKKQGSK